MQSFHIHQYKLVFKHKHRYDGMFSGKGEYYNVDAHKSPAFFCHNADKLFGQQLLLEKGEETSTCFHKYVSIPQQIMIVKNYLI